ncbi:hypothetical protein M9458_053388, partial [Cirrhinus mrigala]
VTGYQPKQRRIYNYRLEFNMTGVIAKRQWAEDRLLNLRQGESGERKNEFQSRPVPSESHVTLPAHPMSRSSTCRATDRSHPSTIFCGHKWGPYNVNLGSKLADPAITSVRSALKSARCPLKPTHATSATPRPVSATSAAPGPAR